MEKIEDLGRQMDQPVGSPLLGRPGAPEEKKGRASSKYEQAFITALRSNFKKVSDVLEEGTDGNGGYLVPEEWDARLIEALEGENIMRRLATVIPTTGEHKIPVVATKPAAAWIDEGEALTWSNDPTFGQKILDAHKLHVAVKITEELLYDNAYNLSGRLPVMFADALGNAEEEAFLTGNGSGKPTGVFDATNGGTASASVAAASLTADNIIDLIYSLKRPYRKNATFIMNDINVAKVRKFKDPNGFYLWQPAYQAGEPDKLCGYNLETSAYAPTTGIAYGDFKFYNIGDRGVRSFQELKELFAGNGMVGFVCKERVDGILTLKEAVQILTLTA
jgi:HK97 family phage major capsid protein